MDKPAPSLDIDHAAAGDKRLARKRYACRLPLELASRLEALREAYPGGKRNQLLQYLLRLGLAEVERAWETATASAPLFYPDTRQPVYLPMGPFSEFHSLVHKHHLALERELAKDEDPQTSHPVDDYVLDANE